MPSRLWGMADEINYIRYMIDNKKVSTKKKKKLLQNYLKTLKVRVWDTKMNIQKLEKFVQDELAKLDQESMIDETDFIKHIGDIKYKEVRVEKKKDYYKIILKV